MASVPPLFARRVSKYARNAWRHRLSVVPSRRISGIGHVENAARTRWAMRRPSEVRVAVRGAELLRALPRNVDLLMGDVCGDGLFEPGALAVGELLLATAQDHADPVKRIVAATAVTGDVLLDTAPHVVDGLGAELHDMERVKHCGDIFELVIDRVLVAVERVQRRDFDAVAERFAARREPVAIRLPGASGHLQQPRPHLAISGWGEIDHASQRFRPSATRVAIWPSILARRGISMPTADMVNGKRAMHCCNNSGARSLSDIAKND